MQDLFHLSVYEGTRAVVYNLKLAEVGAYPAFGDEVTDTHVDGGYTLPVFFDGSCWRVG